MKNKILAVLLCLIMVCNYTLPVVAEAAAYNQVDDTTIDEVIPVELEEHEELETEENTQIELETNPVESAEVELELDSDTLTEEIPEDIQINISFNGDPIEEVSTYSSSEAQSEFTFNPETNTIVSYSTNYNSTKDIVIPVQINGVDVLHIGEYAFSARNLTTLSFEAGSKVETIGYRAFYNNLSLCGDVEIPASVTDIAIDAFYCTALSVMYFNVDRVDINLGLNSNTGNSVTLSKYYNSGVIEDKNSYTSSTVIGTIANGETSLFSTVGVETAMVFPGYTYNKENALLIEDATNTVLQYFASHIDGHTHVDVPAGIKHIADYAMYGDTELTSITFPSSLETIGNQAFQNSGLEELILNHTQITTIGYYAVKGNTSLELVSLPNGIETIHTETFRDCTALREVIGLENTQLTSIEEGVFRACSSLETVILSNKIITIDSYAYYGASALGDITFSENLTTIGNYAFYGASSLVELYFPSALTYLGQYSFYSNTSLVDIHFSENIYEIGSNAFAFGTALLEVTLPKNLITLGGGSFGYCYDLQIVNFNDKLESIGSGVFFRCYDLYQIDSDEYPFPTTITTVEYGAFNSTSSLKVSIEFPSLVNLDSRAFYNSSFTEIILSNLEVTELPSSYFLDSTSLERVTLPDSIVSISTSVFEGCTKLTNIDIIDIHGNLLEGVNRLPINLTTIPTSTFKECYKLEVFNINEGITEIGSSAFSSCALLKELHIGSTIETIGSGAFSSTASNGRIYIDRPYGSVSGESWSAPDTTWIIWNDMQIGNVYDDREELKYQFLLAFDEYGGAIITNSYLLNTALVIPAEVVDAEDDSKWYAIKSIANTGFYNTSITSLYIESGIEVIGSSAFGNCNKLKTVVIEDGLLELGSSAFSGSNNITSIEIGEGIEILNAGTFTACTSLSSLILPDSLVYMETGMFTTSGSYATTRLYELSFGGKIEFADGISVFPSSLKTLRLLGYSSGEHDADLSGKGFTIAEASIYYADTIDVSLEDEEYLYNTDTNQWQKYLTGTESELHLPSKFVQDGTTYYPCSINDYFLMGSQTTVKTIHIPSGIETIADNALYQSVDINGIRLVYIDKPTDSISGANWGRDFPLFYVIWNDTPVYNDFICDIDDEGQVTLVGYIGSSDSIDLDDFNIWVEVSSNISNAIAIFNPYSNEISEIDSDYTVTTMNNYLFYLNESIEEINITGTITSIGDYSFSEMKAVTDITFNEGLISIGDYTFKNTQGISELILPESLDFIGQYAFYDCNNIEVLDLPSEMDANGFGIGSISYMDKLKVVEIPDNVSSLPNYFGYNLDSLEYMSIPRSVTSLGAYFLRGTTYNGYTRIIEFLDRTQDEKVSNENWSSYGNGLVGGLYKEYRFQGAILYEDRIYQDMFLYSIPTSSIISYHGNEEKFDHIDIPTSFNGRGISVDRQEIATNEDMNVYYPEVLAGSLLSVYMDSSLQNKTLLVYTSVTVPDTIVEVGDSAFRSAYFTEIDLPDSVVSIGNYAFANVLNLQKIDLPQSLETIGNYSFYNCTSLSEARFYENLVTIGNYGFYGTAFILVDLPDSLVSLGNAAFANCLLLEKVTIGVIDSQIEVISGTSTGTTSTFYNTPLLNNINIGGTRGMLTDAVAAEGPWGSTTTVGVYYMGEYVIFDYYVVKHEDINSEIKFYINIWAYCQENLISEIHFPEQDFSINNIGTHNWQATSNPYIYEVYEFGMYRFEGFDNSGFDSSNVQYIFIEEMEVPEVEADDIYLRPSEVRDITEDEILTRANAVGYTYGGTPLTPFIYYLDGVIHEDTNAEFSQDLAHSLEEIRDLSEGEVGDYITTYAAVYNAQYGTYALQEFDIILIPEGTPIVGGNDLEIKQFDAMPLTVEDLENMIDPYATSYDETRELTPNIVDLEEKLEEIKSAEVGDIIEIQLWTYDDIMERTGYHVVTVKILDQGIPIIDAHSFYVYEDEISDFELDDAELIELVKENTGAYATTYDGSECLELIINSEDYTDFINRLVSDKIIDITYSAYDEYEQLGASKSVQVIYVPNPIEDIVSPEDDSDPDNGGVNDSDPADVNDSDPADGNDSDPADGNDSDPTDGNDHIDGGIKTGDSSVVMIYILTMIISLIGIIILYKVSIRNKKDYNKH